MKLAWPNLLAPLRQMLWYVLIEPCQWLFFCFFQPVRFGIEYEHQSFLKRFALMLRMVLPLFLFTYPLAVALERLLSGCFLFCHSAVTSPTGLHMWLFMAQATAVGIASGIVAGVLGDIGLGIVLGAALGMTGIIVGNIDEGFSKGIAVAVVLGVVGGTARGQRWGIRGGLIGSLVGGMGWATAWSLGQETTRGVVDGVFIALVFLVSYLLGYYRILLLPVSSLSAFWAYRASRKNPLRVFVHLHNSSLYWDEYVFLPLPYLQRNLLIAVEQDMLLALKEIAFIIDQRPQQRPAALSVSLGIALRDMEMRESIRDIARATGRLSEVLPQEPALLDPRWVTPFARLADASREAARYCGPLSRQTRRVALDEMLAHLERIYPSTAFSDPGLRVVLEKVVSKWQAAARYE